MQTFIIKPVDDRAVERMRAKLVAQGVSVNLDVIGNGDIDYHLSGHGILAIAEYRGDTLTVIVENKPFYLPLDVIRHGIQGAVDEEEQEETEVGLPLQNLPLDHELNDKPTVEEQIAKITAEKESK